MLLYLNDAIPQFALRALLYEVTATPKPGLVDRVSSGAHTDMDFYTFIDSASVLPAYFLACVQMGSKACGDASEMLPDLQPLGIQAEKDMLTATGGINTHKGLIYALGLLCAACGELCATEGIKSGTWMDAVGERVAQYVLPHLSEEQQKMHHEQTYGAKQFRQYGLLGARGEALSGYAHGRTTGFVALKTALEKWQLSMNDAMLYALLELILVVEDSNVIGRHSLLKLKESQDKCAEIIARGHLMTKEGREAYNDYVQWSAKERVSHGGAADMLAVSVFFLLMDDEVKKW